ncbi:hypothetical protein H9P43_002895 [Blastocladiella emersonii ATCC 22665]|nr:hypothetical protein H9P43_002895 [Blastocladiella emersonii ATCC 22665]
MQIVGSNPSSSSPGTWNPSMDYRSYVATRRLQTLVQTARLVYVLLAIGLVVTTVLSFVGVAEPIACFIVAKSANWMGWVNAYAYFHNELLKVSLRAAASTPTATVPMNGDRGTVQQLQNATVTV